jgi:hypothetical protein
MSQRRYHSVSHGRLIIDIDDPLTEAEKLKVKIETLEMILKSIDSNRCPNFHATTKAQLEDAKSEAETARDAEWLIPGASELGTHVIISGGEVLELSNSVGDDPTF